MRLLFVPADKPNIVELIARAMNTYFNLDKSRRNFVLTSEQRYANRLTNGRGCCGGAAKAYQLPYFLKELDLQDDNDFHEDLQEAMELHICQAA